MKKIFSVEEIKNLEKKEFKKLKNSFTLMKRAGNSCAKKILKSKFNKKIVVLCGPGNNGGDGLVISQLLNKFNQDIELYCLEHKDYKGDAKIAYNENLLIKKKYQDLHIPQSSIIIDCLFGIGLNRKLIGFYKKIVKKVNISKNYIISIDIPSGINGNSGKIMGTAIKANLTYALHAKKIGHTINSGVKYSGKISIIDIGIK